jgi:adenine deaminase
VAPSYRADLVVVEDLQSFAVNTVIKDGQMVARDGSCLTDPPPHTASRPANTIHLKPLEEAAFRLRLGSATCPAIGIDAGQLVTRRATVTVRVVDGHWSFDPAIDAVPIASIERHKATGQMGLGLVQGLGLRKQGALASSVAHDSHNVIVAGTNARDILACVRKLEEVGGGWAVAAGGEVRACLPLPVAGLMSTHDAATVCRGLNELHQVTRDLGCPLPYPFGTLSFLALPVIPELKITDRGLFDVTRQELVRLS